MGKRFLTTLQLQHQSISLQTAQPMSAWDDDGLSTSCWRNSASTPLSSGSLPTVDWPADNKPLIVIQTCFWHLDSLDGGDISEESATPGHHTVTSYLCDLATTTTGTESAYKAFTFLYSTGCGATQWTNCELHEKQPLALQNPPMSRSLWATSFRIVCSCSSSANNLRTSAFIFEKHDINNQLY